MAARFPVSSSSVSYRIKPSWASKILVMYWPAGADSVHRLRSSDLATTILTRATSGATYDSSTGLIKGTSTTQFTDSIPGGYGGLREDSDLTCGASYWGDGNDGTGQFNVLSCRQTYDEYDGFGILFSVYSPAIRVNNQGLFTANAGTPGGSFTDGIQAFYVFAGRTDHNNVTPNDRFKIWANGVVANSNSSIATTKADLIGDTARPLYFGNTRTGTGTSAQWMEVIWLAGQGMTDADMVAITTDPSVAIEAYVPDVTSPNLTSPTGTQTGANTATIGVTTDEGNGVLYGLVSTNATETAATIKASGVTQAITSTGAKTINVATLSPLTLYYAHFVHRDAAGNDSNVANSASFTTAADTTAPILASPTVVSNGGTGANGTVSTNEANGTLYSMVTANATESAATVKTGQTQAVSGIGTQNIVFSGLTPSATLYAHYLHRDAAGNDSAVSNTTSFVVPPLDVTAPVISSPLGTATGNNTATGGVTTNEGNGTLYSYASTNATETAATIKASGQQQTISSAGAKTVTFSSLSAGQQYYAHYLHRDASGNDSNVANSVGFTTSSTGAALLSDALADPQGQASAGGIAVKWTWIPGGRVGETTGMATAQVGNGSTNSAGKVQVSAITGGAGMLRIAIPGANAAADRVFEQQLVAA